MIQADKIAEMFERHNCLFWRIKDPSGHLIAQSTITNSTTDASGELEQVLSDFTHFRYIIVEASDKVGKDDVWRKGFKWDVAFETSTSTSLQRNKQVVINPTKDLMDQKLLNLRQEFDFKDQLRELKEKGSDGFPRISSDWIPLVAKLLGMDKSEISQLAGADTDNSSTLELQGAEVTDEQVKKLEELVCSATEKVGAEKIIFLMEKINKNPKLVDKAIRLMKSGLF